ncbi:MAG: hypothetical protein LC751_09690, partial [Actinobacteria bacterium]|nr:hypothetical protein [Actinomycetota bacterium]MCA1740400.1 hypothetical protein [Actinomycetota bacterium]
ARVTQPLLSRPASKYLNRFGERKYPWASMSMEGMGPSLAVEEATTRSVWETRALEATTSQISRGFFEHCGSRIVDQ